MEDRGPQPEAEAGGGGVARPLSRQDEVVGKEMDETAQEPARQGVRCAPSEMKAVVKPSSKGSPLPAHSSSAAQIVFYLAAG